MDDSHPQDGTDTILAKERKRDHIWLEVLCKPCGEWALVKISPLDVEGRLVSTRIWNTNLGF